MKGGPTAHTINVFNKVFVDRLLSCRLWSAGPPDSNSFDLYLCGSPKYEVYSNNPHTMNKLKHNICETVTSIKASKFKLVLHNLPNRSEVCL
jgi:hypothetical protein